MFWWLSYSTYPSCWGMYLLVSPRTPRYFLCLLKSNPSAACMCLSFPSYRRRVYGGHAEESRSKASGLNSKSEPATYQLYEPGQVSWPLGTSVSLSIKQDDNSLHFTWLFWSCSEGVGVLDPAHGSCSKKLRPTLEANRSPLGIQLVLCLHGS